MSKILTTLALSLVLNTTAHALTDSELSQCKPPNVVAEISAESQELAQGLQILNSWMQSSPKTVEAAPVAQEVVKSFLASATSCDEASSYYLAYYRNLAETAYNAAVKITSEEITTEEADVLMVRAFSYNPADIVN